MFTFAVLLVLSAAAVDARALLSRELRDVKADVLSVSQGPFDASTYSFTGVSQTRGGFIDLNNRAYSTSWFLGNADATARNVGVNEQGNVKGNSIAKARSFQGSASTATQSDAVTGAGDATTTARSKSTVYSQGDSTALLGTFAKTFSGTANANGKAKATTPEGFAGVGAYVGAGGTKRAAATGTASAKTGSGDAASYLIVEAAATPCTNCNAGDAKAKGTSSATSLNGNADSIVEVSADATGQATADGKSTAEAQNGDAYAESDVKATGKTGASAISSAVAVSRIGDATAKSSATATSGP